MTSEKLQTDLSSCSCCSTRRDFIRLASLSTLTALIGKAAVTTVGTGGNELTSSQQDKELFPFFENTPVSYLDVKMQDSLWAPRQAITREVTAQWVTSRTDPHGGLNEIRKNPTTYRVEVLPQQLEHVKFIEAMATMVGVRRDAAMCALIDAWAAPLMAGQAADGYLGQHWPAGFHFPRKRWGYLRSSHESYAIGNYIEAAIAYREATGNEAMFRSAVRAADNMVESLLGGNHPYISGHPEIEQALMRLYAVTGEKKYMQLCGWLLGQIGRHERRPSYSRRCLDYLPLQEQRTIQGHAVRAAFLFNGATEYVGATGDAGYRKAILSAWDDFEHRKMYLHGAGGCQSAGCEGYRREPFVIRPDDTYGESCSVYGNFQWAHNLFRLTGEARYLDTAERMLYNAFYASLSMKGDSSFYCNVSQTGLGRASTDERARYRPITRSTEFATSCCPPNIVKLSNKVGGFFYSTSLDGIYVKHYGASEALIKYGEGVKLTQQTRYPWDGDIAIVVEPKEAMKFALHLRMPAWANSASISVNGEAIQVTPQKGWLTICRHWKRGELIHLTLPMPVERVTMPSQFVGYENKAALMRGPVVYCLEEQDVEPVKEADSPPVEVAFNGEFRLSTLYIPEESKFSVEEGLVVSGMKVATLRGKVMQIRENDGVAPVLARFIPYGVWGNRSPGAMRIWLGARRIPFVESFPAQCSWD